MEYTVSSAESEKDVMAAVQTETTPEVLRLEHDAVDLHVRMAYAARVALGRLPSVPPGGSLVALCCYVATSGKKRFSCDREAGDADNAGVAYCHVRVPPEFQLQQAGE